MLILLKLAEFEVEFCLLRCNYEHNSVYLGCILLCFSRWVFGYPNSELELNFAIVNMLMAKTIMSYEYEFPLLVLLHLLIY